MDNLLKDIEDKFSEVEASVENMLTHVASLEAIKSRLIAVADKLKAGLANSSASASTTETTSVV